MALTLLSEPATRAAMGNPMLFTFSSDVFPVPSAETPRTILASSVVNGFWTIEVSSAAVNLTAGRYIVFTLSGRDYTTLILNAVASTNRILTLSISNPGVVVNTTTVRRWYFGYAIQLELTIGQPTYAATYTEVVESVTPEIDIAPILLKYWQRYLAAFTSTGISQDQLTYRFRYREVWSDSTPSYSSQSGDKVALPARTLPQESLTDYNEAPLTFRPTLSEVASGQVVPFVVLPSTSGTNIIRQVSPSATINDAIATGQQASGGLFTMAKGVNTLQLRSASAGLSDTFRLIGTCRGENDIELIWRNRLGQFDSHVFKLVKQSNQTNKSDVYRGSEYVTGIQAGSAQNYERNFAINESETTWQLTSGKVGHPTAIWLADILQSDEVYYRDGLSYYRCLIQPTNTDTVLRGIQYPEITFLVIGSQQAGLKLPRPFNQAISEDVYAIFEAYSAANGYTQDSPQCSENFISELVNLSA